MEDLSAAVDLSVRKIQSRLGLSEDNATVLLIAFSWNEKFILDNWDIPRSELIRRSGVSLNFVPESEEVECRYCGTLKPCTTHGCNHFLCDSCLKDYAEEKIKAGDLNLKCPLMTCDKTVAPSRFIRLVSAEVANIHRLGICRSYALSEPVKSTVISGLQKLFSQVKGLVSYLWRHKVGFAANLICAFMICYLFLGGGTFQCVAGFTVLNIAAQKTGLFCSIIKIALLYHLLNLIFKDTIIATAVVSSAGTAFVIYKAIWTFIRSFYLALRRRM